MIRWLKSLVAWRTVFEAGVHAYQENGVTGRRRHVRVSTGGYSPICQNWLDGSDRDRTGMPPWARGDRR